MDKFLFLCLFVIFHRLVSPLEGSSFVAPSPILCFLYKVVCVEPQAPSIVNPKKYIEVFLDLQVKIIIFNLTRGSSGLLTQVICG